MKKNLLLLVVLMGLASFTYYFEEEMPAQQAEIQKSENSFLKYKEADIREITLPKFSLVQDNSKFYIKENYYPASSEIMNYFFNRLAYLNITRKFTEDEIHRLPLKKIFSKKAARVDFTFLKDKVSYLLGQKANHSDAFYVQYIHNDKKQIFLVTDESAYPAAYGKEDDVAKNKYYSLVSLIFFPREIFYKRSVWDKDQLDVDSVSEISFSGIHEDFSLLIENRVTKPHILTGLKYNKKKFKELEARLKKLQGHKIHPFELSHGNALHLTNKMGTVKIKQSKAEYWLELYQKYKGRDGLYLKTSFNNHLYELNSAQSVLFTFNVKDFWNKRFHFSQKVGLQPEELKLTFSPKEEFIVTIPKQKTVSFKLKNKDDNQDVLVKKARLKRLLNLIMGVGEFNQADNVIQLTEKQLDRFTGPDPIKINLADKEIFLTKWEDKIILRDTVNKLEFHYKENALDPVGTKAHDYFYVQKDKK